jgi:hypothetical protein
MAFLFEIGSHVQFQMLLNVLEVKKNKDLSSVQQDLKFVRGDGLVIETLNLTLNEVKGHIPCYNVRTEQGDVIIPEVNIISHQKVDGTLH